MVYLVCLIYRNVEDNNPLNLNNLPEDFISATDNGKQAQFEAGSSSSVEKLGQSSRKKKKDDESGKVYECRFCSLKFCKSQALGGHMNRHRPGKLKLTETLNKARMLVFSNENNISTVHGLPAHHLGGFHQPAAVDPNLHFRPAYPVQNVSMRLPTSTHSSNVLPLQHNPPQPYLYPSPPTRPYPPQYNHPSANDYFVGHVLETAAPESTNYTCIGAPVGPTGFGSTNSVREIGTTGHLTSVSNGYYHVNQEDGLGWGSMRGFGGTSHQQLQPTRLDLSLAINRFQDRF
ncbi:hypothetical protein QQ045_019189 [Rhodiola kirilowii]